MIDYDELVTVSDLINVRQIFIELKNLNNTMVIDSDRLTDLFMYRWGGKVVNPYIIKLTPFQIADLLTFEYHKKWEILFNEMWVGFNLGARQATRITETINKSENRLTAKDDVNKVTSYENDDLIVNDGSNSTGKDDLTSSETVTKTNEIIDMKTVYENLSLQSQNSIIETVLNDVQKFITLTIF